MRIRVRQSWKDKIHNPEKVSDILRSVLSREDEIDRDKEHFWVLGLSTSNVIRYIELVSLGTIDKTLCEPSPSAFDRQVTKSLADAGKILGIKLLDAIIVTNNDFWSASAAGMI